MNKPGRSDEGDEVLNVQSEPLGSRNAEPFHSALINGDRVARDPSSFVPYRVNR